MSVMNREAEAEMITEQAVLSALATIQDPDLRRDIVSLGFVKGLRIDGRTVAFAIELTTPACPVKEKLESEARQAVAAIPGVDQVNIIMKAEVKTTRGPDTSALKGVKNIVAVGSGKGGVGKSTVAANLSTVYALQKRKVLHVGCDPKHDSTVGLVDGSLIETFMEKHARIFGVRDHGELKASDLLVKGRLGIDCAEAGGPEPGVGCAGRGISLMLEAFQDLGLLFTFD